jgi:hypothetical protein
MPQAFCKNSQDGEGGSASGRNRNGYIARIDVSDQFIQEIGLFSTKFISIMYTECPAKVTAHNSATLHMRDVAAHTTPTTVHGCTINF